MTRKIIIAIDGFSSCGKSSLAKDMSKFLGYKYIDTGAMYRAVTLFCINNDIDVNDHEKVNSILDQIEISFQLVDGHNHCFLNGVDVEKEIRSLAVASKVSQVAEISAVRRLLVDQQRVMGNEKGVVMDGRDIGTVVFPNAELKIFLTADAHIRVLRRYEEMINKNMVITQAEVEQNLKHRDHIDSTREDSPLRKADDAIVLDTSNINHEEQLQQALELFNSLSELSID